MYQYWSNSTALAKRLPILVAAVSALVLSNQLAFAGDQCDPNGTEHFPSSDTYIETISGKERTFRVHVPRGYDSTTPTPLILVFHGWGGNENDPGHTRSLIASFSRLTQTIAQRKLKRHWESDISRSLSPAALCYTLAAES